MRKLWTHGELPSRDPICSVRKVLRVQRRKTSPETQTQGTPTTRQVTIGESAKSPQPRLLFWYPELVPVYSDTKSTRRLRSIHLGTASEVSPILLNPKIESAERTGGIVAGCP